MFSYAVTEKNSRGRRYAEPAHSYRNAFERDRDRIIHCSAFRRLEGKCQVFTLGIGTNDHYRSRLTHSIEVSQIGRTIAKTLGANETLTEAICLGHDLGHSPFGHTGENILNDLMADFGGFEHNQQTLRIVELLEHPYPTFSGLNLVYETRLGLAKHKSKYDIPAGEAFEELNSSLEGQIADIADRIAYNCHDLEDGIRAGLINDEQISELPICREALEKIDAGKFNAAFIRNDRISKTIIDMLVSDCIDVSRAVIASENIKNPEDVYCRSENIVRLSGPAQQRLCQTENFLLKNLYLHSDLQKIAEDVTGWLGTLFDKFCASPELMPEYYQTFIEKQSLQRTVCDYISGMTDRFCLAVLKGSK